MIFSNEKLFKYSESRLLLEVIIMSELVVNVPEELKLGFKELSREEINSVVSMALREKLSERLMFKVADRLLKNSEITDELALNWGSELKERAAKRNRV